MRNVKGPRAFFVQFFIVLSLLSSYSFASSEEVRAIVFDCDGVLADTEYLKFKAWKKAFAAYDVHIRERDYFIHCGHPGKYIYHAICKDRGISIPEKILVEKQQNYEELQKQGVLPIESAVRFLKSLYARRKELNIRLGLASSPRRTEVLENVRQLGLKDCFDAIVSGKDDLSDYDDPEGKNKPKPYIYQEVLRLLDIPPERCIVFEDSNSGVTAAHQAGCFVVAIPNRYTLHQDFSDADLIVTGLNKVNIRKLLDQLNQREVVVH